MHRMLVMYKRPRDPEAFRKYYESVHLALVARLPNLVGSRHSFDVESTGNDWFAVWEGDFESRTAMNAALATEAGIAVHEDVANYADEANVAVLDYPIRTAQAS